MLCVCLWLLVSSNSLWKLQTNMVQLFIRRWLGENAMFKSLERINLKIFLRTTSSVFSSYQPTKPHVIVPTLEVMNNIMNNYSLFFHEKQPPFSCVKSLWKRLSEYNQQTFSIGHQISLEINCPRYTLVHLTVFVLMITLPQTTRSCVTKCGPDLSPGDRNGFFPKIVPEAKGKQLSNCGLGCHFSHAFYPLGLRRKRFN